MAPTKLETRIPERVVHPPVDAPEEEVIAEVGEALAVAASSHRPPILDEDARQAARRAAVDLATAALTASSAETAAHSDDVDIIAEGIGRRLGLSEQQLDDVMVAARLHDIGKLGVPQRIIEKPATLNRAEWAVIKRHTIIGEGILLAVPELRSAARLVRHSHERWDGGGYPDGLAGEQIPIGSRIVFCADAYHAIRSDRAYRAGRPAAEALAEIRSCAGTQFDPAVVEALDDLADSLRPDRAGRNAAFGRSRRLMALMMIVSVGFTGSAIARSGVIPEAKLPPPAAGAAAAPTTNPLDPSAGSTALGQQAGPLGAVAPGQPHGFASIGSPWAQGMSLLSVMPGELRIPSAAIAGPTGLAAPPPKAENSSDGATPGDVTSGDDDSAAEAPSNASGSPSKAKGEATPAPKPTASSKSNSGSSSTSSSGKSGATTKKASKSEEGSTGSGATTASSSGKGSGKATTQTSGSSNGSGSAKAPKPPKATSNSPESSGSGHVPKPPKAPKAPKVIPAPPSVPVPPPSGTGTGSSAGIPGSSSGGSGSSGSGSSSGGNGHGHGQG